MHFLIHIFLAYLKFKDREVVDNTPVEIWNQSEILPLKVSTVTSV